MWLGLPDIIVVKNVGNHMFTTLEVDFATWGMKGNTIKCRIFKFVQDMQTSTLAISKMDFFMILQLKASIRQLKYLRAPCYAPS